MKTITHELSSLSVTYPLDKLDNEEKILFIDIETTGFTAKNSNLYLIGGVYKKDGRFHLIQWFAERPEEEKDLLEAFFSFLEDYHTLIHFNGNHFDIPYLEQKCQQYELPYCFDLFAGIDLYTRLNPLKAFLKLPNCKQKTLEAFIGVQRKDSFDGGELINVYYEYIGAPSEAVLQTLLLHNAEDMQGMVRILSLLAYLDLCEKGVRVTRVNANYYRDFNDEGRAELILRLTLPAPLPTSISNYANGCYLSADGEEATLKIPLYDCELKYFYSNYKDYYYLPEEDTALHKSVSSFVDPEHRVPATAKTCYTRKKSEYLPQWAPLFKPIFKSSYESKELFFELTDSFKQDRKAFADYAEHIIMIMVGAGKKSA